MKSPAKDQFHGWDQIRSFDDATPRKSNAALFHLLARVGVPALVVFAFWRAGMMRPAILVTIVASTTTIASLASKKAASAIDRFTGWLTFWVGRLLTVAVLGLLFVVIFVPASLFARALGYDALGARFDPTQHSYWTGIVRPPVMHKLYTRPFSYEATDVASRMTWPRRVLQLWAFASIVVLTNFAIGYAWHRPISTGVSFEPTNAAALAGYDWIPQYYSDIRGLRAQGFKWRSGVHFRFPAYQSETINVANGVRRSYQAAPTGQAPIRVYFYGGSTMFGLLQRDVHTIPSEFVRVAEAKGIPVVVSNYGNSAYVKNQEVALFAETCSIGENPDVAIFYDGFNDMYAQLMPGVKPDEPTIHDFARLRAIFENPSDPWRAYKANSAFHMAQFALLPPRMNDSQAPTIDTAKGAQIGKKWYVASTNLANAVGSSYDVKVFHFFQPWIGSKKVDPRENSVREKGARTKALGEIYALVRPELPPTITDLTTIFDAADRPLMVDQVHHNEFGATIVAEAIFSRVEPALRAALERRDASQAKR